MYSSYAIVESVVIWFSRKEILQVSVKSIFLQFRKSFVQPKIWKSWHRWPLSTFRCKKGQDGLKVVAEVLAQLVTVSLQTPEDLGSNRAISIFKMTNPGLFFFIFVLSNTNITEKCFSRIWTWNIVVEGMLTPWPPPPRSQPSVTIIKKVNLLFTGLILVSVFERATFIRHSVA